MWQRWAFSAESPGHDKPLETDEIKVMMFIKLCRSSKSDWAVCMTLQHTHDFHVLKFFLQYCKYDALDYKENVEYE